MSDEVIDEVIDENNDYSLKVNPIIVQGGKLLPRAIKRPSFVNRQNIYHNYTYSSMGSIRESVSYKIRMWNFNNKYDDLTLEYPQELEKVYMNPRKQTKTISLFNDDRYYGKFTAKPLNGYSDILGTLYEKNDETFYNINSYVELYDQGTKYKYTDIPIIDGKFEINKININDYILKIVDSTGKYTPKELNVSVVDVNEDHIVPYITLLRHKESLFDYNEKFIQKIIIGNCLSTNYTLSLDNKPEWLQLNQINSDTYELSGLPPESIYGEEFELTFYLYDYRLTGFKYATKTKKYTIDKKFMSRIFNADTLLEEDVTVIGEVTETSFNGIRGLKVYGKTDTFTLKNLVPPAINNDFTIMFAFTVLELDNKYTKHNLFLGNTATSSSNTFWLGTSPTKSLESPRLAFSMNQSKSTQVESYIEENRTYFVKIVRNGGRTKVFVNNCMSCSISDSDALGIKTLPFMFGDGGWGNYKSNIIVHEYNYINDFGDVNNKIRFKTTEEEIDANAYSNYYSYRFTANPYFKSNLINTLNFKNQYSITDGFRNNAVKHNINIKTEMKTFTISFQCKVENDLPCTIFELEKTNLKVHYKDKYVYFTYNDIDVYNVKVDLDQLLNFDMVYNKKGRLTIYFMGSKRDTIIVENMSIKEDHNIYIGMNKYEREDSYFKGYIYDLIITEGVLYIGDHIYINTPDPNVEPYNTRRYKTFYQSGYKAKSNIIGDFNEDKVVDINDIILSNNLFDLKTVAVDGAKYKYFEGKHAIFFEKITDRVVIQSDMLKYANGFDIQFEVYWSGERESTAATNNTFISSNHTMDGTTWSSGLFTVRANGTGETPPVYYVFNGGAGGTPSTKLKVGWNTIRLRRDNLSYYMYVSLNGSSESSYGFGHYNEVSLGGTGGFLTFGYGFDRSGMINCAIANLSIKIIFD